MLTVYGIETLEHLTSVSIPLLAVATVLTVYGIETAVVLVVQTILLLRCNSAYRLRY